MGHVPQKLLTSIGLCTKLISCDLRARAKQRQEEELTRQFLEAEKKLKQKEIEEKEYSCVRIST